MTPVIRNCRTKTSPFFTVSINDVDKVITYLQDILSALPQLPQSTHRRASLLETLAMALFVRYTLSDDKRYLDTSILQFTHATLLPFPHLEKHHINLLFPLAGRVSSRQTMCSLSQNNPEL